MLYIEYLITNEVVWWASSFDDEVEHYPKYTTHIFPCFVV
jgi:hypothetical protein